LQSYLIVKDLRTSVERSDPQKVLDGDFDEFMAVSLAARVGEGGKEAAEGSNSFLSGTTHLLKGRQKRRRGQNGQPADGMGCTPPAGCESAKPP
jgi:hypothetical protein